MTLINPTGSASPIRRTFEDLIKALRSPGRPVIGLYISRLPLSLVRFFMSSFSHSSIGLKDCWRTIIMER